MATGGYINNGTKIAYSATSPVSWQRIGQVAEAPVVGITREKVDNTVHGSSIYMRSMPGMAEITDMDMTLIADLNQSTSAAQDALRTYLIAGTTIWFRIEVPVDRTQTSFRAFEFQAYVQKWEVNSANPADRQEIQTTIVFDADSFTVYNAGASAIS
jgi:hypothetical protein